jgi:HSP20 family protein
MLARFSDFNDWPSFGFADLGRTPHAQLSRELERLFGEFERTASPQSSMLGFEDDGTNFVLRADVPGLAENDLQISVAGNTVTLRGERKVDEAPEGYSAHRRERSTVRFARSFDLPARVDADKVTATLKHGVLTLTLPKVAEAQPRQISVKAA